MSMPSDRKYAESHEWHLVDGDVVTIGLTQFAVDELTDVTYVEMKSAGSNVGAGESVGEIESVKATSEIYSAVGGEIIEVNTGLSDDPSVVNSDPYNAGWLCRIRTADLGPLESLLSFEAYAEKYPS